MIRFMLATVMVFNTPPKVMDLIECEIERQKQRYEDESIEAQFSKAIAAELERQELEEQVPIEPVLESVPLHTEYNKFTYMDYRMVTSRTSKQWKYRTDGWTRSDGVRMYGDYIQVAMGYPYGQVDDKFRLTTETGQYNIVLGDSKGDRLSHGNSTIEIIVADDTLDPYNRRMGDLNSIFGSTMIKLEVLR